MEQKPGLEDEVVLGMQGVEVYIVLPGVASGLANAPLMYAHMHARIRGLDQVHGYK